MRQIVTASQRHTIGCLVLALLLAACQPALEAPAPSGPGGTRPTAALPTAVPQPTALPAPDLLARALAWRLVGEYELAADDLHALLTVYPAAAETRPATFYLAESFALRGRWSSAADLFRDFASSGPPDDLHARALFWLARCQEQAGAHADAVATYQQYHALGTPLAGYALLRMAAQQQALGQSEAAAASYEAAAATDMTSGEQAGAYEKAIDLRYQAGQSEAALALYDNLLALAKLPDYRARVLYGAAALARELGQLDQARTWLRELAAQYPATPQALNAVTELSSDPLGGLAPAAAAQVYDLHEQPTAALPYYDAAVAAAVDDTALELRRQRALARRATGDFAGALAELAELAAAAPDAPVGRQAQLDWVQTRGQSGETEAAIAGYREFAQTYPADPRAPVALSRAVILLERLGDMPAANQQRLDLGQRFPGTDQAREALYSAGWALYHSGMLSEAQAAWEQLHQQTSGAEAARAAFWAAQAAQRTGQTGPAQTMLQAAFAAAPDTYYGARAAEQLGLNHPPGLPIGTPVSAEQWRATEQWIASWSGQPDYDLAAQGYPPELSEHGAVQRAIALDELNLQAESIAEWNAARAFWQDNPSMLYLLARLADAHSVPYIALKAAEAVLLASPTPDAEPPSGLLRLIFPVPYSQVLLAQSQQYGLDPRALYALLRQESLFNPGATSWVGARGLAQVMPATGQGIAQNLGLTEFQEDDLYRPAVSIRFGAFYLSRQLTLMEGSLQGALAAYNGGPGNAQRWANGTSVADPDLFTESIDYGETRSYVKLVYGHYGAYQRLYAWEE